MTLSLQSLVFLFVLAFAPMASASAVNVDARPAAAGEPARDHTPDIADRVEDDESAEKESEAPAQKVMYVHEIAEYVKTFYIA